MSKDFITLKLPETEQVRFRTWIENEKRETRQQVKALVVASLYKIVRLSKTFLGSQLKNPTGTMGSAIRPLITSDGYGGSVEVDKPYSPFVEFGTGDLVVAPDDVKEYAWTFKGKGIRKVNLRARPFFFPAVRIVQKELIKKLEYYGFYERPL